MNTRTLAIAIAGTVLASLPAATHSAQTVHLQLKIDGAEIKGESTIASLGRADSIEVYSFVHEVTTGQAAASGLPTGKRQHLPVVFIKRVGKSSPLLMKALCNNEPVNEAVFRFYQTGGSGKLATSGDVHYYTITLTSARITGVRLILADRLDPATAVRPPTEEVTLVYERIIWTHEVSTIEHQDDVSGRRQSGPVPPTEDTGGDTGGSTGDATPPRTAPASRTPLRGRLAPVRRAPTR